jgi:predicted nucleotidyltransferase component of viral defense system
MDKSYADTVRLLLTVAPAVFANDIFAMKGGTAINLFVQDMPRLSVDIDVVYLPWQVPRDDALRAINQELATISARVETLGVQTRLVRSRDLGDTKLIVENETSQVKVEVNVVFRGTVLPVERRSLSARTGDRFGVEFEVPILAPDELYAGKLAAALDRQHPRDLFDVWQLLRIGRHHRRHGGVLRGLSGRTQSANSRSTVRQQQGYCCRVRPSLHGHDRSRVHLGYSAGCSRTASA